MINTVLEIVSGNLSLLRAEFLLFLAVYVWKQLTVREVSMGEWLLAVPLGVATAGSLFFNGVGEWGRTAVVWVWRVFTAGEVPLSEFQLGTLFIFSTIAAVGLLLMIRVFTKPLFGSWPWIACGVSAMLFTALTLFVRLA